jgi:hypothetical protein
MESISLVLDPDGSGRVFDELLHRSGALPEVGDLKIVTKNKGTESGKPIAVLAFSVVLPSGRPQLVQAVTTVALLKASLAALNAKYPDQ